MKQGRFQRFGISGRFIGSMLMVLVIPLTMLFVLFNGKVDVALKQQNGQTVLETMKQARQQLQYMINDIDFVSIEVLGSDEIQQYLKNCINTSVEESYAYRYQSDFFLGKILKSRSYIQHLALYTPDGELAIQCGQYMQDSPLPTGIDIEEVKFKPLYWWKTVDNQAYASRRARGYETLVFRPVNDLIAYGKLLGLEKMAIQESYICSLYRSLAEDTTSRLFLVDRDGTLISSINKAELSSSIAGSSLHATIQQGDEGYRYNGDQLVTWCRIKGAEWTLVRVDDSRRFQSLLVYRWVFYLCIGFVFLFGVVFYFYQKKTIIFPIIKLSKEVAQFREGNYLFSQMNRGDEIGKLNQAFVNMGTNMQNLIEQVYKMKLLQKEAELKYLQGQINPHFLNNTLESIRWSAIRNKQPEIAKQVETLARVFKHALNSGEEITTVGDEIVYLKDYLAIQNNRYGHRIDFIFDVDAALLDCQVINLVLQPIVENAITHGLEEKLEHGIVVIRVYSDQNDLCYAVEDNGLGTDMQPITEALNSEKTDKNAFALTNIHMRLRLKYGQSYGISFESAIGEGTKVIVRMPQIRNATAGRDG